MENNMDMSMDYKVIQIDENTWRIEDHHVRFFLLTGRERALLIDSGMFVKSARAIAEGLTDLPLLLLNTHADRDHVGCNHEFESFYMHPSEAANFYNTQHMTGEFTAITEGEVIDLGERPLEIVALPGHTPGSIGVLDIRGRVLFSGDPIQDGNIFMFGVQREIHVYLKSLRHLDKYRDRFDLIYPSHGSFPVQPALIDQLYDAVPGIFAGKYPFEQAEFHGQQVKVYDVGIAHFLLP